MSPFDISSENRLTAFDKRQDVCGRFFFLIEGWFFLGPITTTNREPNQPKFLKAEKKKNLIYLLFIETET